MPRCWVTVLVDAAIWPWKGRRWAHLISNHSLEELHRFATSIGKLRVSFQGDHYDVHEDDRAAALVAGAHAVASRDIVKALRAAGLRQRPSDPTIDWARHFTASVDTLDDLHSALDGLTQLPGGVHLMSQAKLLISQTGLVDGPVDIFTLRGSADLAVAISARHDHWLRAPDISILDVAEAYSSRRGDMVTVELLTGPGTAR